MRLSPRKIEDRKIHGRSGLNEEGGGGLFCTTASRAILGVDPKVYRRVNSGVGIQKNIVP